MFNEELYKKLEDQFGIERMISFAGIMAARHDILFSDSDDALNGEDFERDWWLDKFAELSEIPRVPSTVVGIMTILQQKGYSSVLEVKNCNDFDHENVKL